MKIFQLIFLIFFSLISFGQELPPIEKFTTENYLGDSQNWMISQGQNNYIYVANNKGLLEYNGAEWRTYTSPNNTIIRAVNVIGDRIYTGCFADFGYWVKDDLGSLKYVSLLPKLHERKLEDEQIWNILAYNEWVIFQSSDHIYFYNSKTDAFKIISSNDIIYKIFKVNNRIYYHVANQGIYVVEDGNPLLLISNATTKFERIINIFQNENELVFITRNSGFYTYQNNTFSSWEIQADKVLKKTNIFSSIRLEDGSYVIGTISDGVFHINKNGEVNYQITQKTGLGNNTILSLFEDSTNNVWAGLDNGINCINVKSPIRTFFDYEGVFGTVYATQVFNEILYIGTNQGLFYKNLKSTDDAFSFIEGTAGQVWNLFNYNNETLFCGHHLGTFTISKNTATKISNELGAWVFKPVPNQKDVILQGNYSGVFVLSKQNERWSLRNKIEGFKISSRYLEICDDYKAWVNHEHKGVFKLQLNDSLTKVKKSQVESSVPLGNNSSLVKYKNTILYASDDGVFKYDDKENSFVKDSILTMAITDSELISGKLLVDKDERLWAFSKENISYIENDDVTSKPRVKKIPIPSKLRKGVLGFENISSLKSNTYVLGTADGYITLDDPKMDNKVYQIHLNSVVLKDIDDKLIDYPIDVESAFEHQDGILIFKYSVPEFDKFLDVKYQYKLAGHNPKWSKWSESSQVTFENLSFGDYSFQVRAKVGNQLTENTIAYVFKVHRPWFASFTALAFYFLLLLLIIFITHKAYKRYYNNKFMKEQLENEQTIMQIKNEKLNQDIENKNRELAISTMSIINKNRVLNKIKKELKKNKNSDNKTALELVDSNLNDSKDWSFFEQAFNNADKDFLEKIKASHPDLTPNDLRFCAYLRLNLSSKEMAPLLNISIKSVETKRYRLRKKLGLEHDSGLVNYILKF
ncbi:triple tyrosine motif-containing protein [Algibacter sp.]|uniref:triple tyrosine motif-containing protein n=1 Tax=Algibacter sp. TaxID=1872428 RepID=UPI003C751818